MALDGTPLLGENTILAVEGSTPGTFVEVGNMHTYSKDSTRATKRSAVFNKTTPITTVSKSREQSATFDGYESPGDAGQNILNAAEAAGTPVKIKVTVNGTEGYTQTALVSSYKGGSKAESGELRDLSYTFLFTADPTAVGSGYTLL